MYATEQSNEPIEPSYIDNDIMQRTLSNYDSNPLYRFLSDKLSKGITKELFKRYNVGTAKLWGGSTVFWQVDVNGKIRTGKVMLYDDNGHRVKEPVSRINWAHSILKLDDFQLQQCLFGEHLLSQYPDKPVAIVESEKTAIIASHYVPIYVWLATGGKGTCWHENVLQVLKGRKVELFPDLKCYDDWKSKLPLLTKVGAMPCISDELELHATPEQREAGLDIADILLHVSPAESIWENMKKKHPALAMLQDRLHLEVIGLAPPDVKTVQWKKSACRRTKFLGGA